MVAPGYVKDNFTVRVLTMNLSLSGYRASKRCPAPRGRLGSVPIWKSNRFLITKICKRHHRPDSRARVIFDIVRDSGSDSVLGFNKSAGLARCCTKELGEHTNGRNPY